MWGAYAQGFLTGRYTRDMKQPPEGSRITMSKPGESSSWERLAVDRVWTTQDTMRDIGERHGKSLANVAMAWMLQAGTCDVALMGAYQLEQFENGLGVLDLKLDDGEMEELRLVSTLEVPYPMSFWNAFCYHDSEYYGGIR